MKQKKAETKILFETKNAWPDKKCETFFVYIFCQVRLFLSSWGLSEFVRKETKGDVSKFLFGVKKSKIFLFPFLLGFKFIKIF